MVDERTRSGAATRKPPKKPEKPRKKSTKIETKPKPKKTVAAKTRPKSNPKSKSNEGKAKKPKASASPKKRAPVKPKPAKSLPKKVDVEPQVKKRPASKPRTPKPPAKKPKSPPKPVKQKPAKPPPQKAKKSTPKKSSGGTRKPNRRMASLNARMMVNCLLRSYENDHTSADKPSSASVTVEKRSQAKVVKLKPVPKKPKPKAVKAAVKKDPNASRIVTPVEHVTKRLASLNASAIMSASYSAEPPKKKFPLPKKYVYGRPNRPYVGIPLYFEAYTVRGFSVPSRLGCMTAYLLYQLLTGQPKSPERQEVNEAESVEATKRRKPEASNVSQKKKPAKKTEASGNSSESPFPVSGLYFNGKPCVAAAQRTETVAAGSLDGLGSKYMQSRIQAIRYSSSCSMSAGALPDGVVRQSTVVEEQTLVGPHVMPGCASPPTVFQPNLTQLPMGGQVVHWDRHMEHKCRMVAQDGYTPLGAMMGMAHGIPSSCKHPLLLPKDSAHFTAEVFQPAGPMIEASAPVHEWTSQPSTSTSPRSEPSSPGRLVKPVAQHVTAAPKPSTSAHVAPYVALAAQPVFPFAAPLWQGVQTAWHPPVSYYQAGFVDALHAQMPGQFLSAFATPYGQVPKFGPWCSPVMARPVLYKYGMSPFPTAGISTGPMPPSSGAQTSQVSAPEPAMPASSTVTFVTPAPQPGPTFSQVPKNGPTGPRSDGSRGPVRNRSPRPEVLTSKSSEPRSATRNFRVAMGAAAGIHLFASEKDGVLVDVHAVNLDKRCDWKPGKKPATAPKKGSLLLSRPKPRLRPEPKRVEETGRSSHAQLLKATETVIDVLKSNGITVRKPKLKEKSPKPIFAKKPSKKPRKKVVKEDVPAALQPVAENSQFPKWSNGWAWCGEAKDGLVYLKVVADGFSTFVEGDQAPVMRKCYQAIVHQQGDVVRVRDCILLRSGTRKLDLPFVAKVTALWESPGDREMMVSVLWYYRKEQTSASGNPLMHANEVFASRHCDVIVPACIEDKCYVLTFNEYSRYRAVIKMIEEGIVFMNSVVPEPSEPYSRQESLPKSHMPPDRVFFCRRVYDFQGKGEGGPMSKFCVVMASAGTDGSVDSDAVETFLTNLLSSTDFNPLLSFRKPLSILETDLQDELRWLVISYLRSSSCPDKIVSWLAGVICASIAPEELEPCEKPPTERRRDVPGYNVVKLVNLVRRKIFQVCGDLKRHSVPPGFRVEGDQDVKMNGAEKGAGDDEVDSGKEDSVARCLERIRATATSLDHISFSSSALKNKRAHMEDVLSIIPDLSALFGKNDCPCTAYCGVFDGHSGAHAALFAASHLHRHIVEHELYGSDLTEPIRKAFVETDRDFCERFRANGGSTGLVCVVREKKLYLGWLGDSEAMLYGNGGSHILWTPPHRPNDPSERARINAAGGCVTSVYGTWRVMGTLAISRAIEIKTTMMGFAVMVLFLVLVMHPDVSSGQCVVQDGCLHCSEACNADAVQASNFDGRIILTGPVLDFGYLSFFIIKKVELIKPTQCNGDFIASAVDPAELCISFAPVRDVSNVGPVSAFSTVAPEVATATTVPVTLVQMEATSVPFSLQVNTETSAPVPGFGMFMVTSTAATIFSPAATDQQTLTVPATVKPSILLSVPKNFSDLPETTLVSGDKADITITVLEGKAVLGAEFATELFSNWAIGLISGLAITAFGMVTGWVAYCLRKKPWLLPFLRAAEEVWRILMPLTTPASSPLPPQSSVEVVSNLISLDIVPDLLPPPADFVSDLESVLEEAQNSAVNLVLKERIPVEGFMRIWGYFGAGSLGLD
ncbi:unnamed protein product [Notodromas monacha]|uniref:BAH domain-containing protein n=1 Tax=Notodromas monacha TaxID=399045 RepID=A0A7R9GCW6_9CRUS|nr:unnamed protein product [Notodromas monacha]CAG0916292.1 unnamed protein product [Notodromas monacha]